MIESFYHFEVWHKYAMYAIFKLPEGLCNMLTSLDTYSVASVKTYLDANS